MEQELSNTNKDINGYSINELPLEIRQQVIDKQRDINLDNNWYDSLYYEFGEELDEVGVSCKNFFWSIDRDRHFYMSKAIVNNLKHFLKSLELEKELLCLKLSDENLDIIDVYICDNRRMSNYGEVIIDYDESEKSNEDINIIEDIKYEMENKINNWIESKGKEFLNRLEKEYDYLCSDEGVIDMFEANDYRFDKNGDIQYG